MDTKFIAYSDLPDDVRIAIAELAAINNISVAAVLSPFGMTNPEETLKHNLLRSNEILQKLTSEWGINDEK